MGGGSEWSGCLVGCVILRFSDFQQKSMGVQSKSAVFEAHPREGGPKTCTELHDTPFSRLRGRCPEGGWGALDFASALGSVDKGSNKGRSKGFRSPSGSELLFFARAKKR